MPSNHRADVIIMPVAGDVEAGKKFAQCGGAAPAATPVINIKLTTLPIFNARHDSSEIAARGPALTAKNGKMVGGASNRGASILS